MKKATYFAGISLAALLMLLPVITQVNHTLGKLSADGCPLPPPIPNVAGAVMVADGCPLPPPIPNKATLPVAA